MTLPYLIRKKQTQKEIRGFSLANSPDAQNLMVATRLRDTAFKRVLKELPLGTELKLEARKFRRFAATTPSYLSNYKTQ
ncbi:hypothetical protein BH10PSE19_BH10PSE19_01670 [soil metagenome]